MDGAAGRKNLKVILTRQHKDNRKLRALLEARGVFVKEVPTLEITYIKPKLEELNALTDLSFYDGILFSSRNGVDGFFAWLKSVPDFDSKNLAKFIGTVGSATACRLEKYDVIANIIAKPETGSELAGCVIKKLPLGSKILAIRGTSGMDQASKILARNNYKISRLTVYDNNEPTIERISSDYQAISFASPLGVQRYLKINVLDDKIKVVAIGSTTGKFLEQLKIKHSVATATDANSLANMLFSELENWSRI